MNDVRLKYVAQIVAGQSPPSEEVAVLSAGQPFLQGNAEFGERYPSARLQCSSAPKKAHSGDILLSVRAPVGALNIADRTFGIGRGLCAIRASAPMSHYLWWWLQTQVGALRSVATGSTFEAISSADIGSMRVPSRSTADMHAVSDFLEAETVKIDALIAKQEQLIATLQKSRSTTVDLILDQYGFSAPRSLADLESATPPEGWRIIHLGTVLRQLTNGFVGPTRDILVDEGVPYIQSTHIKQGRIDFNRRPFYVRKEWHDQRPRIHLREGDVLIVQTGDIGKVAVVPPKFGEASCHALQIARVKPEILTGSYLGTFLSSWIGYHQLCSMATGALHPHLEAGIRAVSVVVPPLPIQSKIVRQASEQTAKIDELVAKSSEVINTLQEYRSALITDAVTGKIDVRGAVYS